ncbi:MAG: hypothetical protein JJE22_06160 [Bacteroidia bacterium]|nr:hypothetical protein [Bacteroidia bacterium]
MRKKAIYITMIVLFFILTGFIRSPIMMTPTLPVIQKDTSGVFYFSRDHGSHTRFHTEWWYFNGQLTGPAGKKYSYAFCLFRCFPLLYYAHISFTDETNRSFTFDRKFYPFFKVKFGKQKADVSYGKEQTIEQVGNSEFRIKATLKEINLNLMLALEKPPLLINGNGLIDMEGGKSFYYSLTRLRTSGNLEIGGCSMPVTGNSWMDHQWGNFHVLNRGWDWFSFQMEDSTEYNLYSFRNKRNKTLKQFVNILDKQNRRTSIPEMSISRMNWWNNKETSNRYTTSWEIILPVRNDTFIVSVKMMNQELFASKTFDFLPSYWEGACTVVKKTANGGTVRGLGYAEQFPYGDNKELP